MGIEFADSSSACNDLKGEFVVCVLHGTQVRGTVATTLSRMLRLGRVPLESCFHPYGCSAFFPIMLDDWADCGYLVMRSSRRPCLVVAVGCSDSSILGVSIICFYVPHCQSCSCLCLG